MDIAKLKCHLAEEPIHHAWARRAVTLGYRQVDLIDDSNKFTDSRIRLAVLMQRLEVDDFGDLKKVVAADSTRDDYLTRVCYASTANGFQPVANPYDILSLLLLDTKRRHENAESCFRVLVFKPQLWDALSVDLFGKNLDRDDASSSNS